MTLISKTKQPKIGENHYKESIARALNKYKREINFPRGSRVVTIIMRAGSIIEKIYQAPDGKTFTDRI